MKKHYLLTPVLLLATVGVANAEGAATEPSVMSSGQIDKLSSQQLYWNKVNQIETQKNAALTLKVQNNNLQETAEQSAPVAKGNDVRDLQEFLNLSLSEKELVGEDSKNQEEIISENSEDLVQNIETMGAVDSRGNVTSQSQPASADQLKKMQKQQAEFFEEMVEFVNEKLNSAPAQVAPVPQDGLNEVTVEIPTQPENAQKETPKEFSYDANKEERAVDQLFTPPAKIKRVRKDGVEVVFVFDHKEYDDGSLFVTALVKEGQEELILYPSIRYKLTYQILSFTKDKIVFLDEAGKTITATR